jgi:hypothetical protein
MRDKDSIILENMYLKILKRYNDASLINFLKESPDSLEFEGERFKFDNSKGNPITFTVDRLSYTKIHYGDYYNPKLGMVVIYSAPVIDYKWVSHRSLQDILSELTYTQIKETKVIRFFSPKLNVNERLDQLLQKYPEMDVMPYSDSLDVAETNQGRMWRHEDKVVIALWENDEKFIEEYIIPFALHVYPDVSKENIYIEDTKKVGTFFSASQQNNQSNSQIEPYQKELANLQRQLHLTSGDQNKRNQIRNQIKELALKHNLDPKKYGIDDEEMKFSQNYTQKVLGNSKETLASLKSKIQTSESWHIRPMID